MIVNCQVPATIISNCPVQCKVIGDNMIIHLFVSLPSYFNFLLADIENDNVLLHFSVLSYTNCICWLVHLIVS